MSEPPASLIILAIGLVGVAVLAGCARSGSDMPAHERANPLLEIPESPLGIDTRLLELEDPPTPERVRLGRWLFYDRRLSADGTVSCASCHEPEAAFSELEPVSTGVHGLTGTRKSPSLINLAWTLYPHFFWDGRAASLEEQALGPVENPVEMGQTIEGMIQTLESIQGYAPYFEQAFGTMGITPERVAKAIADYERTRMSGNSPWDRWKIGGDEGAVSDEVKLGDELFFGKARCSECHLGQSFTDSRFHNLGVGWDPETGRFEDVGRHAVSNKAEDMGAFKTPTLREVSRHPPFMHDGSQATLREVIELYNQGGIANPHLSPRIGPLDLAAREVEALIAFLESLNGEGYEDSAPAAFPE
jgi:cytochrome c peroxidase